jgi:hypothetical protein
MLRHLATEQGAPGLHTSVRDAADDVVDDLGDELADGDVVEEEQRLGTLHGDVVDRHGDEIDADRVVAAGEARDQRLGAHPVGRGHEQRVVEVALVEREETPEPADVADDLRPEGGAHVLLDELHRALTRGDVDPRPRVRQGPGACHPFRHGACHPFRHGACHPFRHGACHPFRHGACIVARTHRVEGSGAESSSSASLESESGTGTG